MAKRQIERPDNMGVPDPDATGVYVVRSGRRPVSRVASRNPQNEYCEWHVTRNAAGKITKAVFVTESPEYWQRLWDADRATVVNVYKALVDPAVTEADLRVGGPGSG